ncbi:FecR domain-containing protein [Leptospira sp. 201903071]|uniref:FecR family protein n=1 Tax=Leptospira ainazelensis TaxID=2810034 RepID=UPI00196590B5|nr:FecR family protein [Leptospira ainazelensis]MBM9500266.1 FecR domain-containing protein [Leptospira ainazelensis]
MTKEKFLSGDRAILVLLTFNIVLFTAIFLYDYTRYGYKGNQKVIGTILYKTNTIQRKFDSEVIWKDIDTGNSIQNRDTILTAEGSQAKLKLLDGTEILIAENSMIFIDYLDNRANLEISVGGLQVTRRPVNKDNPSSLGIRSGDGVLKLVEGIVNVEKKKNQKNLEYAVLSGTVKADPSNPIPLYPKKSLEGFEKLFPVSANLQTTESIQSAAAASNSSSAGNTGSSNSSYNNSSGGTNSSGSSSNTNSSSSNPNSSGSSSNTNASSTNSYDPTNDPSYGKYDNGNPNYRKTAGSNGNSDNGTNSGNPSGNGQTGLNTKSGLKLDKTSSGNSETENKNRDHNSQNKGSGASKTGYDPGDYLGKQKYEQNKIQEKSDPNTPKNKTENSKSESKTETKSGASTYQEVKKPKPPRELTPEEIQKQEKEKRRREREDKEQREFLRM